MYNYKELNDIIKELSSDELLVAVIPDWIETAKGKERVLRAYVEHKPTEVHVTDLYRDQTSGFKKHLKMMIEQVRKKAITKQLQEGTADTNALGGLFGL